MGRAHEDMEWPGLSDGSTDSARASEIVGAWYGETARHLGWRYDQWFHPACRDVARALLGSGDLDETVVRLGSARSSGGRLLDDALADFSSLLEVAADQRVLPLDEQKLTAALATGFEAGAHREGETTGFAGPLWLQDRLAGLYADRDGSGVDPLDTHAVLLVDVPVGDDAVDAGLAVHAAAEGVRSHLALADQVVCLTGHRFAVLVHRHPGLALSAATLETALRNELPLADVPVHVWVETLPAEAAVVPYVGSLMVADPRPGAGARAGLGTAASALTGPLRPASWTDRLRRRFNDVWDHGLSLVAAGVGALVLAAGLAQAVAPDGSPEVLLTVPAPASPESTAAPLADGVEGRTIPTTTTVPNAAADGGGPFPTKAPSVRATPPVSTRDSVPPGQGERPQDRGRRGTPTPTTAPTGEQAGPPVVEPEPTLPGKRKGEGNGNSDQGKHKANGTYTVTSTDDQPRGRPKTS